MFSSLKLSSLRTRKHANNNNNNNNNNNTSSRGRGVTSQQEQAATLALASKPPKTPVAGKGGKTQMCPSIGRLRSGSMTHQRSEQHVTPVNPVPDSLAPYYSAEPSLSLSHVTHVTLERDAAGSLGVTLRGGVTRDPLTTRPLTVTQVRAGGPTDREGSIQAGDRVVSIDGVPLHSASLLDVQRLLQQSQHMPLCALAVEYDVMVLEAVQHATGPLWVEIETPPGKELGVTLAQGEGKEGELSSCVVIESIRPASIAERCGALHVGDQVLAVGEVRVEGSLMAARLLTRSTHSTRTTLEILPTSHANCGWRISDHSARSRGLLGPPLPLPLHPHPQGYATLCARQGQHNTRNNRTTQEEENNALFQIRDTASLERAGDSMSHTETLRVVLRADDLGYGLTVMSSATSLNTIVISSVEPGGPADRSGCVQVGDRISAANQRSTREDGLSCADVHAILSAAAHHALTLDTEFDVADAVLPPSGVFAVELCKRGGGLGITITASESRGGPLIISDIARGSVAHRSGSLQSGDELLAIDATSIENCSLQQTEAVLQASADVVTLHIRKHDARADVNDTSRWVVYTVDIACHGGPLGISLSGSGERFQPIRIAGLSPGGLAGETGALHVGDRLLAINAETLHGKPLSAAIALLHQCSDHVTLKVARSRPATPRSPPPPGHYTPGLPSVDSAVESWDSRSLNTSPLSQSEHTAEVYREESATVRRRQKITMGHSEARQRVWTADPRDSTDSRDSRESVQSDCSLAAYPPPSPLPLPPYPREDRYFPGERSSTNQHAELYQVTLYKDAVYDDYGFSVSDGLYERGVYVNRVRKGGPADMSVTLKPFDRILQVNDTRTYDFDCCLTVPLIASAGERLELTVARYPNPTSYACHEEFYGSGPVLSWVADERSVHCATSTL